ncbi:ankyrin repeat-containing domain protein [Tuber borchii]|uniref:Ankyrin repeat-containing domain protein n=1 Tax=Tuber borchii TaxID=42251 RepID=A0A2T6ZGV9_TUBBO|nr:ankyrin repeat-containing domain protein [Tuber borchii]
MSSQQVFPLLSLPNELIVAITDLHSFLLTNRRLSALLPTALQMHAAHSTLSLVALYWAISMGNKPMTALLLQKSTQVLTIRTPSHTLLHRTPCPCPAKTLSLILAHGGAIHVQEEATGRTPQHFACKHSRPNLLYRMLAFGAAVEATDREGWTPLHVSVISRREDQACTRVLLRHGANLSARERTRLQRTPLHFATKSVRVEELREFLDQVAAGRGGRGANVGARDGRGMTALHVVARGPYVSRLKGRFEAVAWLLIRRGADGTIRDRSGSRVVDILEGRRRPAPGLE